MKRLDKYVFARIVKAVEERAKKLNVGGFMIVSDFMTGVAMFALVNRVTPLRIDVPGKKDANFAAVAGAKFGMVFTYRHDTGGETNLMGEVPFQGGHVSTDGECGYIFSGAAQEVDLALMILAEAVHRADTSPIGPAADYDINNDPRD